MKETLLNMEAELVVFGETEKIHGKNISLHLFKITLSIISIK